MPPACLAPIRPKGIGGALLALAALLAGCQHAPRLDPPAPPTWVNSLGMVFVQVPAGRFWMGGVPTVEMLAQTYPQLEKKRFTDLIDEAPGHEVHVRRAFYLGQHEVTVGQFRRFLAASGYQPESEADGTGGYGYNARYDPATTRRGDASNANVQPNLAMCANCRMCPAA